MKPPKVNLLTGDSHHADGGRSRAKRPWSMTIAVLFIFCASFAYGRMTLSGNPDRFDDIPLVKQMRRLIGSPDRSLLGETQDRINILLMGMGGEGHDGPNLTDTMMIASVKPASNQVALLSVPRDMVVPLGAHGWRKINSANAFGEAENPGTGGEYARKTTEDVFGIDIPYYVRVDFDGFKEVVDDMGGVDVYVGNSFVDATYPTDDYKTQVISFKKGWQHFDGEAALKFTRSRHGNNGEGSDFARAKRQQLVLLALKDKMLSFETLKNPSRVGAVLSSLRNHITTNLQVGDILRLAKIGGNVDRGALIHKVIDAGPDSPLAESNLYGAYVLIPKKDDWSGVREVAANIFDAAPNAVVTETPPPAPLENAKVEIRNGTKKNGLARQVAARLSSNGFDVVKIGNSEAMNASETTICDNSGGTKMSSLERLKEAFSSDSVLIKKKCAKGEAPEVDFIVVLGQSTATP